MNNFKISLDKYLTNEPHDNFDTWCDLVIDLIPDNLYELNEDYYHGQEFNKLLNIGFNEGLMPIEFVQKYIIEEK